MGTTLTNEAKNKDSSERLRIFLPLCIPYLKRLLLDIYIFSSVASASDSHIVQLTLIAAPMLISIVNEKVSPVKFIDV